MPCSPSSSAAGCLTVGEDDQSVRLGGSCRLLQIGEGVRVGGSGGRRIVQHSAEGSGLKGGLKSVNVESIGRRRIVSATAHGVLVVLRDPC